MRVRVLPVAVLALATALVVAGFLLVRDVVVVQAELTAARDEATVVRDALRDREEADVVASLERIGAAGRRAGEHLDGPAWWAVAQLPRVGDTPAVLRAVADLAATGAEVGTDAFAALLGAGGEGLLRGVVADGAVDLDALRTFRDALDAPGVDPLREAALRLAATDPDRTVSVLRGPRAEAVEQAERLVRGIDRSRAASRAALELLGGNGPRTYLVAAQNPAELRGTGGLIGFLTELEADEGRLTVAAGEDVDAEELLVQRNQAESEDALPEPVERPDFFAARYDPVAGGQFLGSVNLDPDLPTVAPVLARLYEQEFGRPVDGVVLLDPLALGGLVTASGKPLELPEQLDTAGLPHRFDGKRIPDLVMVEGYDAFGDGGAGKKAFDRAIITASLDRLVRHRWNTSGLVAAVDQQLRQRHLQVWSPDAETQAAIESLRLGGSLSVPEDVEGADLLAVTASNSGGNKADVHVRHEFEVDVALAVPVPGAGPLTLERDATVTARVVNPLRPDDHVGYVTSTYSAPGDGPRRRERNALVRTWFTVWSDATSRLVPEATPDGAVATAMLLRDQLAVDHVIETPSETETATSLVLRGDVPVRWTGEAYRYDLHLWRQAKAVPDDWAVTITPPDGWTVTGAEVAKPTGERVTALTGEVAPGDGGGLRLRSVDAGEVVVAGTSRTDATVSVLLTPNR